MHYILAFLCQALDTSATHDIHSCFVAEPTPLFPSSNVTDDNITLDSLVINMTNNYQLEEFISFTVLPANISVKETVDDAALNSVLQTPVVVRTYQVFGGGSVRDYQKVRG